MSDREIVQLAGIEVSRVTSSTPSCHSSSHKDVPVMSISKDGKVRFKNTERHPASNRCAGIAHFVQNIALKGVPSASLKRYEGDYYFEPHDAVQDSRDAMTLCFARNLQDPSRSRNSIVFPDFYQMFDYDGMLPKMRTDLIPWSAKLSKVLFAGTTTGSVDPSKNRRVQSCIWSLKNKDRFEFKLSSVCQMTSQELDLHCREKGHDVRDIMGTFMSPAAHMKYKYIMNIEGNTCCWSRVPMIMSSNSLMMNLTHEEGNWFYPFLEDGVTHVDVLGIEKLEKIVDYYEERPLKCQEITAGARAISERVCTQRAAALYSKAVLDAIADMRKK